MAVLAAQWASGHEHRHAGSRAIDGGHELPRVHEGDIAGTARLHELRAGNVIELCIISQARSYAADTLSFFRREGDNTSNAISHD